MFFINIIKHNQAQAYGKIKHILSIMPSLSFSKEDINMYSYVEYVELFVYICYIHPVIVCLHMLHTSSNCLFTYATYIQ